MITPQQSSSQTPNNKIVGAGFRYAAFATFLLYCILPALWLLAAMTKDNGQIFTTFGLWFAAPLHLLENSQGLFAYRDGIFVQWFGNSLIYATSISVFTTLIYATGGYGFAKYDFPGKKLLFSFIIATVTVPSTALVLPLFLMLNKLGMLNTFWGVILPSLVNPFGLYLMRIFWEASFPTELLEAARIDGASEIRIFWGIGMPLIVLSDDHLFPLTLGLNVWNTVSHASGGGKPVYNLIALGSFLSVVPLLIAFILLGRYWRRGLTAGATTG